MTSQHSALSPQPLNPQATPLRGWINTYYRYHKGKKLGPYYVRRWKVAGKIYKAYIKPGDLPQTRAACDAHRETKKRQAAFARNYALLESNLNYLSCMCKRLRKGPLREEDYAFADEIKNRGFNIPGRPSLRTNPATKQPSNRKPFMVPSLTNCFSAISPLREGPRVGDLELPKLEFMRRTLKSNPTQPSPPQIEMSANHPQLINPIQMQCRRFQSSVIAAAKKEMSRILRRMETDEEKLNRWRKERDAQTPEHLRIKPSAVSAEEIDNAIDQFLKTRA